MIKEKMEDIEKVDEKEVFYGLDFGLLLVSLVVLVTKLFVGYWSALRSCFIEDIIGLEKAVFYLPATWWLSVAWLVKPIVIGIMMSFVTWQIVYLDSDVPGVLPPTPISSKLPKTRLKQMQRYHLCYLFALAVAPLTTISLILINNIS